MNLSRLERETVIIFNDVEDTATIWSASPQTIRRLQKMGFQGDARNTKTSKWFVVPKNVVTVRKEVKKRKTMTVEQRTACAKRMLEARKAKQTA